ncbi:hypothetical protein [Cohnella sp.]|uniref:hypothetical protein n=1 Tax=Cohnella sp. TaxID=1883426 RepID=UPI003564C4E9
MSERYVREKLAQHLRSRISANIEHLKKAMNYDIRYFIMYPLIFLEEESLKSKGNLATISHSVMRTSLSWFLKNIENKGDLDDLKLRFNLAQYEKFKNKFYPFIKKCFQDYRNYLEVCDHGTYAHSQLTEVEGNIWRLETSLVSNKYYVEKFYFERHFEEKSITEAEMDFRNETDIKFFELVLKTISENQHKPNQELYEMCLRNLEFDFKFLGPTPISSLIPDFDAFKKVLASLQYMARVNLSKNVLIADIKGTIEYKSLLLQFEKDNLIMKIIELSGYSKEVVSNCLKYLSLDTVGSLFEFPLIQTRNKFLLIPSSILVNDWHFSFVNGHYARNRDFKNRNSMISSKVIDIIEAISSKAGNIKTAREHYYECLDSYGKPINSDIDFALYDRDSNVVLVLEVKWKSNHYISEIDYNHLKIQNSLFEIYNEQINKHKEFLRDHKNIEELFKCEITIPPKITYLAIDKRNQLYLGEEKMMSVYMLAALLRSFLISNSIHLQKMIEEINSLKTKVEYFHSESENVIQIDELTILSDQISSDDYFQL